MLLQKMRRGNASINSCAGNSRMHSRALSAEVDRAGPCGRQWPARPRPVIRWRVGDKIRVEIPPPRPLGNVAGRNCAGCSFRRQRPHRREQTRPVWSCIPPRATTNTRSSTRCCIIAAVRWRGSAAWNAPASCTGWTRARAAASWVAKTDFAHKALVAQFQVPRSEENYRAVCWGKFARSERTN